MNEYTNAIYPTRGHYVPVSGDNKRKNVHLFSLESEYIGIDPDFQYRSFGKTLKRSDKKENYKDVLNDLGARILHYGKATTPEEEEELTHMASDYMRLSEYYNAKFGESIHAIREEDIRKSENADILAKAYCEKEKNVRDYETADTAQRTLFCAIFGGIAVSIFAGIGIGLITAGVAAAIGGTVVLSIKAADLIRQKVAESAAKKIITADARNRIKDCKNQLKKARKRAAELKFEHFVKWISAGTNENRRKINEEYRNLSAESKTIIADNKKIIKEAKAEINERVRALPKYSDYAYKRFLYQSPAQFMAEEANRKYNEIHGINPVQTMQTQQNQISDMPLSAERTRSPMVHQQSAYTVKPTQPGKEKSSGASIGK